MGKSVTKSNTEYTRSYDSLRGVDFSELSSEPKKRFAFLENMYVDYEAGGGLESIPGFRTLTRFSVGVNRIFSHRRDGKEYLAVHAGNYLYYFDLDSRDKIGVEHLVLTNLNDARSCAFSYGENLYIFDGKNISVIDKPGNAKSKVNESADVYVPTTYIDGKRHEQRNLLTDKFYQKFTVRSVDEISYGSDNLTYAILDYDAAICAVSGSSVPISGELHIPSYTMIGKIRFKVTEILDYAFENQTGITKLFTNCNLKKLGHRAFAGCTSLEAVYLSDTVESIGTYSFDNCSKLYRFYVGAGFKSFGSTPFNKCVSLKEILYAKSSDDFEKVENQLAFEDRFVQYNIPRKGVKLAVELHGGVASVTEAYANGKELEFSFDTSRQILVTGFVDRELIQGRTLVVSGLFGSEGDGFLSTELGRGADTKRIITDCTLALCFDGRVFLSGNPALPGAVFYSGFSENGIGHPLYFGAEDYFIEGIGGYPVASMLTVGENLLIFKSGDDGAGSIFYHTSEGVGTDRRYPASFIRNGLASAGDSTVFMGEGVFASSMGICAAIDDSGEYPKINCLSEKISRLISSEKISDIRMTEWQGYLAVCVGGRIYLADSRSRYKLRDSYLCEWYYLNGIGTYKNDTRVYRYASKPHDGYSAHPKPDEKVLATVYSKQKDDGTYEYYTKEAGTEYGVYLTDEYEGGEFYPATEIFSIGDLLFFGTRCGDFCVFNNDKRGQPPPELASESDFDPAEYKRKMGSSVHPYYYTFGSHAVKYTLATALDNCDLPYYEKTTVRSSPVIKFKCMSCAEIAVMTRTDVRGVKEICRIQSGGQDFYSADFSNMAFSAGGYATLALKEYERGWIEKQYILSSVGFRAPIGIHSLSYRYKIKGKIRNS